MSYLDHFKLNELPFRLTPDPDFIYMSEQHARAKSYMGSTIWFEDGFVVITGEVGSGKTTILQSFLSELDEGTTAAVISQTQLNPTEFLQAVLYEFGFEDIFGKGKVELLTILNRFLLDEFSAGRRVVLIVDEAQNLSREVLEEIRLLSSVEAHKEKVLRIILAGQPELKGALDSTQLRQLTQRVRCRFHLNPLNEEETKSYIDHRLKIAGNENGRLFDPSVYPTVYKYTGGVPRMINTLCDTALLCAFAEDKSTVQKADIEEAFNELGWKPVLSQKHQPVPHEDYPYLVSTANIQRPESKLRIEVREKGLTVGEHYFESGRIVLGRAIDSDIRIRNRYVSQHHAEIVCDGKDAVINDLDSTNGIFIRGDRVRSYNLKHGDVFVVGVHELCFTRINAENISEFEDDEANTSIEKTRA